MTTVPYPYQVIGARRIKRFGGRCLLADEAGLGKAQPLSSRVLTPSGWVRMADVYVGMRVIGSDGLPHAVTGVHPQGVKDVYCVVFKDGASVRCCDEHLWAVRDHNDKTRGGWRTLPLKAIRCNLVWPDGRLRWQLPMPAPVEFDRKNNLLDPYLIGYLLANGGLTTHTITVTVPDLETVNRLATMTVPGVRLKHANNLTYRISGDVTRYPNPMTDELRRLGMMPKGFAQKEVPKDYLYTSFKDRLALFQGLMDGDGSCSAEGVVLEYSTGSQHLARQVDELVRSFGGMVRTSSRRPYFTYKGVRRQGSISYRLNISLPEGIAPFRLSRKADAYRPRTKYQPVQFIKNVTLIGREECQCITVDAPDSLYITDDYILTHNSLQSLLYLHRHPDLRPCIVVCPASLKWNWEREARVHFGMRGEVLEGMTPKPWGVGGVPPLLFVNYDILAPRKGGAQKGWLDALKGIRPQAVILDECQALQDSYSKRTKAVRRLCQGVPYVVALSGTPLTNRPAELFPVLNILRPDLFGNWMDFARRYCAPRWKPWGWEFKGATRLDELHATLTEHLMIRRLKADVLQDLPAKSRCVVPLPLERPREYRQAELDFLTWLAAHRPERLDRAARAERLVKVGYLKRLAGELKSAAVCDWADNFLESSGRKLVLFAIHKPVVAKLRERFGKVCVVIDGDTNSNDRRLAVQKFQNAPACRVLIGNVKAAGTGLTLTAASDVAFAEVGWTPGEHSQAEDRVHRIGQTRGSTAHYLIAHGTIEERLVQLITEKQGVLDATLDGGARDAGGDVFNELIARLQRQTVNGER